MKATTIIIAAVLSLQMNVLLASSKNSFETPVTNENSSISLKFLAPTTPNEADFEEVVVMNEFANLAPTAPAEATFEDISYEMESIIELAPTTPAVADFDDAIDMIMVDINQLAPVTPAEVDFE